MSFARVLPGGNGHYKDSWGAELVRRGIYQLYMGGTPFRDDKGMADRQFDGAIRRIRRAYDSHRVPVGGKLIMRLRTGELYVGTVTEIVEEVRMECAPWDVAHRTPKHIRECQAIKDQWSASGPMEAYVLTYQVDWQLISHPSPTQQTWIKHQVAAIQRRKEPFPSA
jgi:hypothetical protein